MQHCILTGILDKEKGQILRVAANVHVYFGDTREDGSMIFLPSYQKNAFVLLKTMLIHAVSMLPTLAVVNPGFLEEGF